ncbi:3-phosphoglycerate dehydrogenase [Oceanobacillus oncorhynchi subsp. incaldanensis]|uniref:Glyoxylate/hydroxypyruvate reductase B n=1 Tax=Oceanobacillus oncorhynchi TaxID=545501 RepID=A0A0A1MUC6_9BACI|nr:D-2-hydroxyacid dehydrogenase [Oceanobacillus oncorhynchi]UUI41600.1 D-2-hydroxyacid dehydrogenase [Oceanobacillus oncorhynchi]GIO17744.1 3-phosphoglycerate dehydrogenase [Oceanobacillus oncorhynchi subsp. incaldanensis]CEI83127.1 Glyoxylate/hydroxypyruvate reductase B [Oceanobacillus oncorhynchi]
MAKRTMAIHLNLEDTYVEEIKKAAPDWEIHTGKELSDDILKQAEILVNWRKDKESTYLESNQLKWVQSWSAGVDSLNLDKIVEKNIQLTSANGVHSYPISETIFAYILGFTRLIHTYVRQQQEKVWHHAKLRGEIHNKTMAVLGTGKIGQETAKIAKAFGMKVLGVRHSGKAAENVDEMYQPHQLDKVLPQSDYVVVTLPLTEDTHRLIGAEQFKQMKNDAFFVNIGRGSIVDEKALIEALENNEIAGAGLDVFEKEPLEASNPLWEMENVILTPHTAGATEFYNQRVIEDIFIPNLKNYLDGKAPSINLYQHERGY